MPLLDLIASSGLGSLVGMRHALEPDHLAAVSTLVMRERDARRAVWLGVCWGLGHTLTLVAVGAVLVTARAELPAGASDLFEFAVAVMLVGLGMRAIWQAVRLGSDGPIHTHHHGRLVHTHHSAAAHVHIGGRALARTPLLVGAVHGLAGSGALTALVLATLSSNAARLAYMGLFGLGSTLGMAALSGMLGWPLARIGDSRALSTVSRLISLVVGLVSTGLGVWWGYPLVARFI
jgi:hypothetical protein